MWYVIHDTHGDEIFCTGSVLNEDESKIRAEVLLVLSKVNGSNVVMINEQEIQLTWK